MRISDRYIGRQILFGTIYAVIVLAVVLVLGNLFKQIKPLLVEQHAPLTLVARFVINVLPLSLMYTVPWGFLSAVLLVFGKLSSNQEITGFRVAGVSLPRLAAPVFAISILLSLLSLWLNNRVVPLAKASTVQILYEQAASDPDSLLKPGIVQGNFGSKEGNQQKVLIEGKDGEWVTGFHYYQAPSPENPDQSRTYVHADRAALSIDSQKSQLRVKLQRAYFETRDESGKIQMGFAGNAEPLMIDLKQSRSSRPRSSAMTNEEIRAFLADNPGLSEKRRVQFKSEIMKRYSFSMACFAFAFVAIPLGLKARRSDTSSGLVMSLLIGMAYFMITVMADEFNSELKANIVLWAPNVLCILLGLFLFRRARFK
ncbi:MAG: LptF/LptG family permease [Luteolibacter sp.]